jgi:hypothetical protein
MKLGAHTPNSFTATNFNMKAVQTSEVYMILAPPRHLVDLEAPDNRMLCSVYMYFENYSAFISYSFGVLDNVETYSPILSFLCDRDYH